MRKAMLTVSILGMLAAAPAFAACMPPASNIKVPDGATATYSQMLAAQSAIKALNQAVMAYGDCLDHERDAKIAAGGDKKKLTAQYAKLNNAQVDKLQQVATLFNTALQAYQAKHH